MYEDQNVILTGMMFGDEGKGSWTEYFASLSTTKYVVRTSGGAQAAHNVISRDGIHHTFAQFGAASFIGVPTILSKYMMVEPYALVNEGVALSNKMKVNAFSMLTVSENSLVTTPIHAWINQKLEDARGANRHGSTGLGIGETTRFSLTLPDMAVVMKDLDKPNILVPKLKALVEYAEQRTGFEFKSPYEKIRSIVAQYGSMKSDGVLGQVLNDDDILDLLTHGRVVFEGSQGVLLDEDLGFHPHTTWSRTTSANARSLLEAAGLTPAKTVGLIRKYATRHGAGPFPGEFKSIEEGEHLPEPHNGYGKYQGGWRRGLMAMPLLNYAVRANEGVDAIAVSHWDVPETRFIESFDNFPDIPDVFFNRDRAKQEALITEMTLAAQNPNVIEGDDLFIEQVASNAKAPVIALSEGPTVMDKKFI